MKYLRLQLILNIQKTFNRSEFFFNSQEQRQFISKNLKIL